MSNYKLDQEELEILEAYNSGKLESVPNLSDELKKHQMYATATLNNNETTNIPISNTIIMKIQNRAIAEGISGKSLINQILTNYIENKYTLTYS